VSGVDERLLRLGDARLNRYDLYELCVQCPPIEAAFCRALHRGEPVTLGEDFCGPASIARAWLAMDRRHTAVAVDLDVEPLGHAVRKLTAADPHALDRFTVRERDALEADDRCDIIAALNFAVCELHDRARLVTYLRNVQYRLATNGVAVFDVYAGEAALSPGVSEQVIETDDGTLLYVWQQVSADPTTGRVANAIHFETPDGQRIDNAFVYDWRLWSVPELRDALREAGFASTEVHNHYGEAIDGEGNLLLGPPVSSDEAGAEVDPEAIPEADEPAVYYVVGRV
jgi:hypothetical protein